MEKILVSACLLGQRVRYHGGDAGVHSAILLRWLGDNRVVPLCPEIAGGLPVPRPPAERRGLKIETKDGTDVTSFYQAGAQAALRLVQEQQIRLAVLKEGSPSCGVNWVYDGAFSGRKTAGRGLTAALLAEQGVRIFSEQELEHADAYLSSLLAFES